MRAADLYEQYEKNEVAADQTYKGRLVMLHGIVKDIGKDIAGTPYVILGENRDNPLGVQAMFAPSDADTVAALSKGQRISVECLVGGKMMNVIVRGCSRR
jgi:hypothetical protein